MISQRRLIASVILGSMIVDIGLRDQDENISEMVTEALNMADEVLLQDKNSTKGRD